MHPNSQVRAAASLPYITLQKVAFEQWLEFLRSVIGRKQMPSAKEDLHSFDPVSASHREVADGKFGNGIYSVVLVDGSVTSFYDYEEVPSDILMVVVDTNAVRVVTDLSDPENHTYVQPLLGSSGSGGYFNWNKERISLPLNLDKLQVDLENGMA